MAHGQRRWPALIRIRPTVIAAKQSAAMINARSRQSKGTITAVMIPPTTIKSGIRMTFHLTPRVYRANPHSETPFNPSDQSQLAEDTALVPQPTRA